MKTAHRPALVAAASLIVAIGTGQLLAQQSLSAQQATAPDATNAPPATEQGGDEQRLLREAMDQRLREVLQTTLPAGSRARSLVAALEGTVTGSKRAEIVTAYWKTVRAAGEVAAAQEAADRLQSLSPNPADAPAVRALLAQAEAVLQQAKVALKAAQYRLAESMGMADDDNLPFPSDIPHTGGYRTYLDRLMPPTTAPWELRMLDRTLPLRRQTMILHHTAVQAAGEAWSAYRDAYASGSPVGPALLRMWKLRWDEDAAFFAAAEDYNLAILGFASRVAPADLTASQYVGMLIETSGGTSKPEPAKAPSEPPAPAPGTSPNATSNSTSSNGGWTPSGSTGSEAATPSGTVPLPAAPGTGTAPAPLPAEPNSPTAAPPPPAPANTVPDAPGGPPGPQGIPPAPFPPPAATNRSFPPGEPLVLAAEGWRAQAPGNRAASAEPLAEAAAVEPADRLPAPGISPATYLSDSEAAGVPPLVPLAPQSTTGAIRHVQRYAAPDTASSTAGDSVSLAQDLLVDVLGQTSGIPAAEQHRRLAASLFGRELLPPQAEAADLAGLLRSCPSGRRPELATAYWDAALCKAAYVVWMQRTILLAELFPAVLQRWSQPGGALAMLELQADRAAADAGLEEAHRCLIEAAFNLRAVSGKESEMLPIPSTTPLVQAYATRAEALPAPLRTQIAIRAALGQIDGNFPILSYRFQAASTWDAARREAATKFAEGTGPLTDVLLFADSEFRELFAYAAVAGAYNKGIAEYVLAAYPRLDVEALLDALGTADT